MFSQKMAEGGDFGYDDPDLDRKFDNYDDEDENEVTRDGYDSQRGKEYRICPASPHPQGDRTRPFFLPDATSIWTSENYIQ